MGDFLQHVGITALCPHGGQISVVSTNMRVKVMGQFVAVMGDVYTVSGCPAPDPATKSPPACLKVQWTVAATRVKVMGKQVLLKSSAGICQNAAGVPQGSPNVSVTQVRVKGL